MGNDYLKELYQTVDDTFSYLRKKWTIPIIKGLFCDCKNFKGFLELNPGLSSKVLSERLKELEENGIVEKVVLNSSAGHTEYYLTEKGRRLNRIIFEMFNFALDEVLKSEDSIKLREESKESLKETLQMNC
ncbi:MULTISPECIES: helix-turn-helix domain-containing protein [Methanobacterium]|jgi:DNA-binding HxlR family transcriptional regulator|uniref:HxlR family transcriptional regulator n=1 Tax=Methanobacterium formicicum (strain DSM 3637 / PP1) TaxID=1204725 RepID=K2R023_METFP|nr:MULTISPECIES: helix-turn-helix domain-containing protein [Methanobacterium]EKF85868.1 HxlR family transcriptional regulator [Methanobacterium formicicum DSM 3637]MDY9924390.1 helix-turn-helix domain-containing protein [Methanobacterium sp.]